MNDLEALSAVLVKALVTEQRDFFCGSPLDCRGTCEECALAQTRQFIKVLCDLDEASFLRLLSIRKEVRP
jgi:hypothetical protein